MPSSQELVFEFQNAIDHLRKSIISKHACSGLKGAEKHILFMICEMIKDGHQVTISGIANKIGVTLAAITHQINSLKKQGLINRVSDNNDRRLVIIEFTKKGGEYMVNLKKEFAKKTQLIADFLGEEDTKDLIRLVGKLSKFRVSIGEK
jgi:DNA-binding MarR family transcriptional regulator